MVAKARTAAPPKKEVDLNVKAKEAITRARVIAALESNQPLTLTFEDRRAAAGMLRASEQPRVRASKQECVHLAAFYWRLLKKRAVQKGRLRWTAEQRRIAAKHSLELAAIHYPLERERLKVKPADVLKLVGQPVRKTVKRKNDEATHSELRNKKLIEHFESINWLRGFAFFGALPADVEAILGIL